MKCFAVAFLLGAIIAPHVASAETPLTLALRAQNLQLPPLGSLQTGSFDVFVENSEPTPSNVIAHQVRLSISPSGGGVTFTGAGSPSSHPYIFPTSSPVGAVQGDGSVLDVGDFLLSGSAPLGNGVGLFSVNFAVAAGTPPGSFQIQISSNPNETFLTNSASANLGFAAAGGTITIVPEPAGLLLTASAVALLVCGRRGRLALDRFV